MTDDIIVNQNTFIELISFYIELNDISIDQILKILGKKYHWLLDDLAKEIIDLAIKDREGDNNA